jgi:hypothetical protein
VKFKGLKSGALAAATVTAHSILYFSSLVYTTTEVLPSAIPEITPLLSILAID